MRSRRDRLGAPIAGLALVVGEALLRVVGLRPGVAAALVLIVAPGLALLPQLPRELGQLGRWLAVPIVGVAAASLVIVPASALGLALTEVSVRLLLAGVCLAGLAAAVLIGEEDEPAERGPLDVDVPFWRNRPKLGTALALVAILALAVALQSRVIGGNPVPGPDWAAHLLYPDQIARGGSLGVENPYWQLGGRGFSSDPGVASIYGSYLILTGKSAASLTHGIWVFALLAIVAVFLLAGSLWGEGAGLTAAGLYAVMPLNHNMLGWHGLANVYALCLLPLVLLAAGWALRGRGTNRWAALMALMLVAILAAHRLTFLLAVFAVAIVGVAGLALVKRRRALVGFGLRTAAFGAPLVGLLAFDLVERSSDSGGFQSYKVYLVTKVPFDLTVSDLTPWVAGAGTLALLALLFRLRRDPSALVVVGLAAATVVLAYGYLLHVPTVYYRMAYYLPLAMAVAIGMTVAWFAAAELRPLRRQVAPVVVAAVAVLALVVPTAVASYDRGPVVRDFYSWTSSASAKGLTVVQRTARPGDVVVTDRCWGFLAEWLLRRPVLAGFDPADILPRWEARPAAQARTILYAPPRRARAMARRKNARFLLVNPGCQSDETDELRLPQIGVPVFQSSRLVVFDLRATRPNAGAGDRRPPRKRQGRGRTRGLGTGLDSGRESD